MILCVDVGNTACKLALVRGHRVVRRAVIANDASERAATNACRRVVRGAPVTAAALLLCSEPMKCQTRPRSAHAAALAEASW